MGIRNFLSIIIIVIIIITMIMIIIRIIIIRLINFVNVHIYAQDILILCNNFEKKIQSMIIHIITCYLISHRIERNGCKYILKKAFGVIIFSSSL